MVDEEEEERQGETQVLWALGEASDDEGEGGDKDVDQRQHLSCQREEPEHGNGATKQTDEDNQQGEEGADFLSPARRPMDWSTKK